MFDHDLLVIIVSSISGVISAIFTAKIKADKETKIKEIESEPLKDSMYMDKILQIVNSLDKDTPEEYYKQLYDYKQQVDDLKEEVIKLRMDNTRLIETNKELQVMIKDLQNTILALK